MAIRKYGAAYQGSKSKIADDIISLLPAKKYFVDSFSGGGALAHCALESGKFEHIIANDLQTKDILEAHFLWTPEQHLEFQKKWVTKVEFDNDKFEQWCIDRAREGYEVFVCEYNIDNPAFEEVWSKEVINCGGGNKNQKRSIEKLYHVK